MFCDDGKQKIHFVVAATQTMGPIVDWAYTENQLIN